MSGRWFSLSRLFAMIVKEFIQMKRDRLTFAMMVGIPCLQLALFGYAINTDPKHLPTVVLSYDHSDLTRSFVAALQTAATIASSASRTAGRSSTVCSRSATRSSPSPSRPASRAT
jgi:hypothetical protein